MSAAARLLLFGPPVLHGERGVAFLPERRFQLLALLALHSGEWVARDEAAALLWPDRSTAEARRNLRHVVFRAREAVGGNALEANDHGLRWNVATDLQQLSAALAEHRLSDAVAVRRGPLLEGLEAGAGEEFAQWLLGERSRLDAMWHQAAVEQLAALTSQPSARVALAERMLAHDPCDEAAVAALLEVEIAGGNQAGAERHYRAFAARLAEQLGIEPSNRLRELLRSPEVATAAPRGEPDREFIGRRGELNELARRLGQPDTRVLTIVGPGGVGKSSLMREALAAASLPSTWIELQDLNEIDAVTSRIADRLNIELRGAQDPVAQIARALGSDRRLLALDNAEHLGELPALIERLLATVPALTLLVTSRQRLGVGGESLLPLDGLALPDEDSRDAEAATAFDAVRLFDARARAAQRSFSVERHIEAVVEIVEAVGGSPLAIELAASWVRLLPAEAIARDLRSALDVLERDPSSPAAMSRPGHESMRVVLDGSWALLAPRERDAMEALSVFRGGFTHAAAREAEGVPLPLLSSLVDKSMLVVDESARFAMHPLIAADARTRAARDPAALAACSDRHAEHFARGLAELATQHVGDHRPIVRMIKSEMANCENAWRHAITSGRGDWLRLMVPGWRRYFVATGRFAEGSRQFEQALVPGRAGIGTRDLAELRAALAWFAKSIVDAERAISIATDVLATAESLGDPMLAVDCVNTLGAAELLRGHWGQARRWFERSLQTAGEQSLRRETATALNNLGLTALCDGTFGDCLDHFARAAAIQREMGDHVSLTRTLHNLGSAHMAVGRWAQARDANDEALRYAVAHEVEALRPVIEFMQGATLLELGQLDAAERLLKASRDRCRARGDAANGFKCDYYLARIDARRRHDAGAANALLALARSAQGQGYNYDLLYIAVFVGEWLHDQGRLPEAASLFGSAASAPLADAFVRAVVDSVRALRRERIARGDTAPTASPAFDRVAELLVGCQDIDDLTSRLRPASA